MLNKSLVSFKEEICTTSDLSGDSKILNSAISLFGANIKLYCCCENSLCVLYLTGQESNLG